MTNKESEDICQKALDILGEHYDAVQIMVTWNEESITKWSKLGSGNWFARIGMAHEFIADSEQEDMAEKLAGAIATQDGWDEEDD